MNPATYLTKFKARMRTLKRRFPNRKWTKTSPYERELASENPYFKHMPSWRKWPEYKEGEGLGKRFRKGKATIADLRKFLAFTALPQKTVKEQVVKCLKLAGFEEGLSTSNTGVYERFEMGDYNTINDFHSTLEYIEHIFEVMRDWRRKK